MKRALVISGGGSKGAYAVGVIKRLMQEYPGLSFDMFAGTSTGSLISPLAALGEIQLLESLYTTLRTSDVVLENRLGDRINTDSIFDANPLRALLKNNYTDSRYGALKASGKDVFLTATCLQNGELYVFTTANAPAQTDKYNTVKLQNASHFRKAVMASASQPVFMAPIKVNENIPGDPHPGFQFVDGGVKEYAGIQIAIDNGATEIFTILLSSGLPDAETEGKTFTNLFDILKVTIDIFTDDVGKNDLLIPAQYNDALQYIAAVKKKMKSKGMSDADIADSFKIGGMDSPFADKVPLKLYTFRPSVPLGGGAGGLTFDPAEMKAMVQKGAASAEEFIAKMDTMPDDITWA